MQTFYNELVFKVYFNCCKVEGHHLPPQLKNDPDTTLRAAVTKKYPKHKTVSLSSDICLQGVQYVKDMIISAGQCSGLPELYRIVSIMVVDNSVSFISDKLSSWYLEHYRSFKLVENIRPEIEILEPESLNDLGPLQAYKVAGKLMVPLKVFLLH